MNTLGVLQGRLTASQGRGIQFFPHEHWREEFALARSINLDCIEWLVEREEREQNPLFSEKGVAEINELKKMYRIETPSVHGFYSKEKEYPKVIAHLFEKAAAIGARTVLVSFFKENVLTSDEARAAAVVQLTPVIAEAKRQGVRIGVETELAAPALLPFIESFKSDAVGVYYDIGNMVSMGIDVLADIRALGSRIYGVHIKDRPRDGGKSVPLGEGASDFPAIFRVLKEVGYPGPYIFQGARKEGVDDVMLNARYRDYVASLLREFEK